ncbi:MAG: hypothetical protein JW782_03615 [Candidatus Saganbacteria bacterium]|nr:hypothetical protein [Candidatus Saganbacteria bacterium]
MAAELSRIHDSFRITSLNPVTRAGDGNFMQILRDQFDSAQARMKQVEGLSGVFTMNPEPPQTLASLDITEATPETPAI